MTQIYCFTGLPGAGKSAASSLAADAGHPVVEMGNVVRDRARTALGENATSEAIGNWATDHRDEHGNDVFARYTADDVEAYVDDGHEVVVIDGLRTPNELSVFRDRFEDVTVVFVKAAFETRLARIQTRGREDEGDFTADDLRDRDQRERDWGVSDLLEDGHYDVCLENEGTYEEFEENVLSLLSA